jgi:hypothetical protein
LEPNSHLAACVECYEKLRQMILAGREYCCQGWGVGLLIHRGFMVWIETWLKTMMPTQQNLAQEQNAAYAPTLLVPESVHSPMIMILAAMILNKLQEATL